MDKIIRCYCSCKPIVEISGDKVVVDWEEFAFLDDCARDCEVAAHVGDAATKNMQKVLNALFRCGMFVKPDFTGEAYEAVSIPIDFIKPTPATCPNMVFWGKDSFPIKPFLRYSPQEVRRFIQKKRVGVYMQKRRKRIVEEHEYLEYKIHRLAPYFKKEEDAIACAKGYMNHTRIEKFWPAGGIQIRKVVHPAKRDKYTKTYVIVRDVLGGEE